MGSTGQVKLYDSKTASNERSGVAGVPSDLTLKLSILGRTFSGKKTIAKML